MTHTARQGTLAACLNAKAINTLGMHHKKLSQHVLEVVEALGAVSSPGCSAVLGGGHQALTACDAVRGESFGSNLLACETGRRPVL